MQYGVAVAVLAVIIMLIIPLPTVLLDTLMALNLVFSLLVLLIVLYSKKAIDFSLFPTVLLVVTIFGLALNVSSTRLILTKGARFDGRMIRAFSSFVVGSSGSEGLVVGFIIFIIIIAVQAIVITKGSTRISEVAARFTLDGMPGKQMAIEAEFNAGTISEEEMRSRKTDLEMESSFYGAMDGASKFISGNVIVGILITAVNIIGGIIVGSALHGEPLSAAVGTYISFSIGDGLLSQLPSLLVSTAMGIVVTRASSPGILTEQIARQFSRDARIYWIITAALVFFAVLPGFPWYVLLPMAALIGFYAFQIGRKQKRQAGFDEMMNAKSKDAKKAKEEGAETSVIVPLDPLSLELGYGLIPLVDKNNGAELLERVQRVRTESGLDLGLVIPKIRIIDNMMLEPSEYCFKIKGVEAGRGKIRMNYYLGINPGTVTEEIAGEKTADPTFGLPAVWISEDKRDEAERAGYTVVDPPSIIATHLTEIIRNHGAEILGLQDTQKILDSLKKEYPAVIDAVLGEGKEGLSLREIQKVLQLLLMEKVSIRNMVTILEALAEYARVTRDPRALTEKARQALKSQLCHKYADDERRLHVLTIESGLQEKIAASFIQQGTALVSALDPPTHAAWIKALVQAVSSLKKQGIMPPIILCSEAARYLVKDSCSYEIPELVVLSVPEIARDFTVISVGVIRLET
ncbi:MAG: flagellar biosynthesis protein FlhA [Treponema sp.]|nr:flagellar biosynthesis protein FlhA [Treponema sp.]